MDESNVVAELVDELFRTHLHANGREYSYQEVSDALDGEVDASYIAKLRRGVIKNPGRHALLHLCSFFKVEPLYFFPELQPLQDDQFTTSKEDPIRAALRSKNIQPSIRKKLEELIRALEPEEDDVEE
jgi:transcriptional regulator with XRE-family HTH domain